MCKLLFNSNPDCRKTYHHNHFKSHNNVLKILCTKCNLAPNQLNRELISIYFFNGSKFDNNLIFEPLLRIWGCNNVFTLSKNSEVATQIKFYPFIFKDCLSFLSGTLENNIELMIDGLPKDELNKTLSLLYNHNICKTYFDVNLKKEIICQHNYLCDSCNFNPKVFNALTGKLAYPYELIHTPEDLKRKIFPKYEEFFSTLKNNNVYYSNYLNAKWLYKYCYNFSHFHKIYNILDVLLMASVMNNFDHEIKKN